ncbi:MAG: hypothetical protein AAF004_05365 [Pseudomonadota bacterium]
MLAVRLIAYAVILALGFAGLVLIEISSEDGLRFLVQSDMARTLGTSEWSLVEWLQLAALFVVIVLALQSGRWHRREFALGVVMAALAAAAFIRELDLFLDYYIVDHLWQVLIALLLAVTIVFASRHMSALKRSLAVATAAPALTLIYAGLMVIVFANFLGHAPFWESILGDAYQRTAKIAAEEMTELLGYCLWLAGQIEYALSCRARFVLASGRGAKKQ